MPRGLAARDSFSSSDTEGIRLAPLVANSHMSELPAEGTRGARHNMPPLSPRQRSRGSSNASAESCSFHAETLGPVPRLLDRAASFHQSRGQFRVQSISDRASMRNLTSRDFFHNLVSMSTLKVLLACVAMVIGSWLIIAPLFHLVSDECDLEVETYIEALYITIETIETIGYGISDPMMNNCRSGLFLLGFTALWGSLMNALLIGLVFTRISSAQKRASSVIFSAKGVVCQIKGENYFMFQVFDFRKDQVSEAHVRLHCVQHSTTEGVTHRIRVMRLQHPDDELGGMLLLTLPQLVIHRIDAWSPLCPPSHQSVPGGTKASCFSSFPEVVQRSSDAENGQRNIGNTPQPPAPSLREVAHHMAQTKVEILCHVEGVDPASSGKLQARCSYTTDDIVYNASFQRCVSRAQDGTCEINLDAFHKLVQGNRSLVQSMP